MEEDYLDKLIDSILNVKLIVNGKTERFDRDRCGSIYIYLTEKEIAVYATPLWDTPKEDLGNEENHLIATQVSDDYGFFYEDKIKFPLSFSDLEADTALYKRLIEANIDAIINKGLESLKSQRQDHESGFDQSDDDSRSPK